MKILQFFQGINGENSSKRLAGLLTTLVILCLSIVGGYVFLKHGKNTDFLDLIETLSIFAAVMLVGGLAEILIKNKYGSNLQNPPSN